MSTLPNLFSDETQRLMGSLYGTRPKPSHDEYLAQLRRWQIEADEQHSASEIERIAAEQARLVEQMGGK